MNSLKFGTSGLRGLVTDLVGWPTYAYATAFFRSMSDSGTRLAMIGRDLRGSSAEIAATVAVAARDAGFSAVDCGVLPTPALALEAMRRGAVAVMVTGSHIPADRNGLKFYRPDGEITKADEAAILAALRDGPTSGAPPAAAPAPAEPAALDRYRARYTAAFAPDTLAGLTVGVYQQSTVARDLLVELLGALGATAVPFGRSDVFVPIDTEAHRPEDIVLIAEAVATHGFDALVTADGDADRPLLADETGRILRGDVLGLITARHLGAGTVVVPVTAGSAMERVGIFPAVRRTKVGSPHVIAGMAEAAQAGAGIVVGFEANGGFLLGSDVSLDGRRLPALPTRDAILPLVATLAAARKAGMSLSALVASLDAGETASDRLEHVPAERSGALLARLADDAALAAFLRPVGKVRAVNRVDGVQAQLDANRTIHYRASGNAPELRCYAEATTAAEADKLLRWGLRAAKDAMA